MAAIDDLNGAVSALSANFATLDAAIQQGVAAILAGVSSNDDAAVEAAAQAIGTVSTKMATDAASITAALPATPASTASTAAASVQTSAKP